MLKYNEDSKEWVQLPTEYIGEENGYYLYRASTYDFSWFAIGIMEGATIVAEEKSTKNVQVVGEEESSGNIETLIEEETGTATPAPTEAPSGAVQFAAVLLAGIALFLKRR